MPPAPSGATISYGPSRVPAASAMTERNYNLEERLPVFSVFRRGRRGVPAAQTFMSVRNAPMLRNIPANARPGIHRNHQGRPAALHPLEHRLEAGVAPQRIQVGIVLRPVLQPLIF